jgi:amidase
VEFVVARSLRDVAASLDVLQGNEPGDLYTLPVSRRSFRSSLERPPPRLRIGLMTEMPGGDAHAECIRAAEMTARVLESFGHTVEPSWPAALFEQEERTLHGLIFAPVEHRACLEELEELLGREVREEDVEPFLWRFADLGGAAVPAEAYLEAEEWLQAWSGRVVSWWRQGFDVLITPTVGELPPLLDELDGASLTPDELVVRMGPHMAFTEPFNATGQPALTLPVHWTSGGLPVGVQLVADVGREDLLLRVARQVEAALPWAEQRPPIHA